MASGSDIFTNVTNALATGSRNLSANVSSFLNTSSKGLSANVSSVLNTGSKSLGANVSSIFPLANSPSHYGYALAIFTGCVLLFLILFTSFSKEINQGYEYTINLIKSYYSTPTTDVVSEIVPTSGKISELDAPRTASSDKPSVPESIVERILPVPSDDNEVFNVSSNKYTYYDAEPLCKALGAELATYDQVKSAWERGADWCNYGWVKGQMAVYPTQKSTYDNLQKGPEDQQAACGTVGLNGGHFDNPELEYGVNCYGKKPDQIIPVNIGPPATPDVLKFNKKVNQFQNDASTMQINPFNAGKWSGDLS